MADLKKALLQSLLGKYTLYIVQMASLMVLARLIAPEAFGVVAAAQVLLMFFQTIGTSGLIPAIVYEEKVDSLLRDSVFSFSFGVGLVLAVFFLLFAPALHQWFEFESGQFIFYLLSIGSFFAALSVMPMASLVKQSKFIKISQAEVFGELFGLSGCLGVWFVSNNGLLALGIRFTTIPVVRFCFYWWFSANTEIGRPRLGRQLGLVTQLFNYAKYQILFNVFNYFSRNLDNILIAKYFGASMLGVYEKTYQVMKYPLQLFTFAITPAMQPVLTRYKSQPTQIYHAFFKVASRLAVVGVFSSSVLYCTSTEVVFILFGPQWLEVAPLLGILALSIPVQMIMSSTGGVFQAFGKVREMLVCGVFSSVVTVSAIIYGIYLESVLTLCVALVIAFHINYVQCLWMLQARIFKQGTQGFLIITAILALTPLVLLMPDSVAPATSHASLTLISSFLTIAIYTSVFGVLCAVIYACLARFSRHLTV